MAGSPFALCNSSPILTSIPPTHTTALFSSLLNPTKTPILSIASQFDSAANLRQRQLLFRVNAAKNRRKGPGGNGLVELDDEGQDGDEEEVFLPFAHMEEWLKTKPRGFGEGKVYDTSMEDKLLEEMRQSREAQAANLNKLKNNPTEKDHENEKDHEVTCSGIRVHLLNLPKKKNILRDLKSAFKGVPGIINIIPAVSGNKKTRDPVCKGFAFVDFKSEEHALRFVNVFSKQSITFGKIQKQIKCEILNLHSENAVDGHSEDALSTELTVPGSEESPEYHSYIDELSSYSREQTRDGPDESSTEILVTCPQKNLQDDSDMDELSLSDSWEQSINESDGPDDKLLEAELENIRKKFYSATISNLDDNDYPEVMTRSALESFSSKHPKKTRAKKKRPVKQERVPNLVVPGAAKRLKVKEKAILTGVLTKYGLKADSASEDKSY